MALDPEPFVQSPERCPCTFELEERIADFKNVEACVVFQSGFAANAGTVSAVLGPEDHIISDELNHASIIDGCRLSKAKIHVFPHRDTLTAEAKLAALKRQPRTKAIDHRWRFLDGRRHRPVAEARRTGGAVRSHHDDRRRPFVRRAGPQWSGYGRSFRSPWAGGYSSRHAIESDRRSGRVCVRQS